MTEIAVVGLGCRYPDARSPRELWHNALAGRRAFRRIPEGRLRLADYEGTDGDPDSTYVREAALVEDFEIDRAKFKISGPAYRATDLAHWLALDVADQALRDAGLAGGAGLPRETTGVLVGNSLTGEGARAQSLRLRWPYARRAFGAALSEGGLDAGATAAILERAEAIFKQPFAPFDEDTLAGGLSNTIAGRICNAYDLGGGGFTVDGACSSSLLAVAQACSALAAGDLDAAIAGGVDVSLDPFELVGFARLGALARGDMRVYDRAPTGFLPGEGAGMVVLMRRGDAEARQLRIHAVIRGWGIASDGEGGITRPRPEGHRAAIARCYARAGYGVDEVALFEGHGTGTAVGDAAELAAIAGALRDAGARRAAAIGSIKAQIGHTKAAAGAAGLLKAIAAVSERIVPPSIGIEAPHAELAGAGGAGYVLRAPAGPEPWPAHRAARAGVSAIGFGGINAHVVVEAASPEPVRRSLPAAVRRLARSRQDCELLVLAAASHAELAAHAAALAVRAGAASRAELGDLAAALAAEASLSPGRIRCAVVAAAPDEARASLEVLAIRAAAAAAAPDEARASLEALATRAAAAAQVNTGAEQLSRAAASGARGGAHRQDGFPTAAGASAVGRAPAAAEGSRSPAKGRWSTETEARTARNHRNGATPAETVAHTEQSGTTAGPIAGTQRAELDVARGRFFAEAVAAPRIAFLFTGQAAPVPVDAGALGRRFDAASALWVRVPPWEGERVDTRHAQPAIAAASLAAAGVLEELGLVAEVAVGHSLGELSALAWAGSWPAQDAVALAAVRGRAMAEAGREPGGMLGVAAGAEVVRALVEGTGAVIAAYNAPAQTVVSGPAAAIDEVARRAAARGCLAARLATSHAFHSPLLAAAAPVLEAELRASPPEPPGRRVISTVTGAAYGEGGAERAVPGGAPEEVIAALVAQVTEPVRFSDALRAAGDCDLWIEVGPGQILARLAAAQVGAPVLAPVLALVLAPVIAVDACGSSLRGLLSALGAAWVLGAPVDVRELFADRWCKPVRLDQPPRLFTNPCEAAPPDSHSSDRAARTSARAQAKPAPSTVRTSDTPHMGAPPSALAALEDRLARTPQLARLPGLSGEPSTGQPPPFVRGPDNSQGADLIALPSAAAGGDAPPRSPGAVLEAVRHCIAEAIELPPSAVSDSARLLEDLHLSSITISHVVGRAARALGVSAPRPLAGWARATVAEIAIAFLDEARPAVAAPPRPAAAADWVRAFAVIEEDAPPPPPPPPRPAGDAWQWHGSAAPAERAALARALEGTGGGTVLVLEGVLERDLETLVAAAREARGPVLVIDPPCIADGFARTWHLETGLPITVVSYDRLDATSEAALRAEASGLGAAGSGFRAVHISENGRLRTPVLDALDTAAKTSAFAADAVFAPPPPLSELLGPTDTVLVTGGGKGIGAECALALAERTGCAIVTVGRATPDSDPALAANLARFAARGVRAAHCAADLTDPEALRRALAAVPAAFGPITALVHAAAVNEPRALHALSVDDIARTIAPKVTGYAHALAALDPTALKVIAAFGSVIARTGLPGEAHYALANELLRHEVEHTARRWPHCRCAVIEFSAWAEVGMAERIGRLDALLQRGLAPISIERGVDAFLRAFGGRGSCVIAGRLGDAGVVAHRRAELPLTRFLERPLLHIPGVELVVEAALSPSVDLYADDHVLDSVRVMPAVMQLEAATQVAAALAPGVSFRVADLRFPRAIAIDDEHTAIRIAACLYASGAVDLVITAADDDHTSERMRAHLEPLAANLGRSAESAAAPGPIASPRISADSSTSTDPITSPRISAESAAAPDPITSPRISAESAAAPDPIASPRISANSSTATHHTAALELSAESSATISATAPPQTSAESSEADVAPPYDTLLPQRGRFRRIRAYRTVGTCAVTFTVRSGGPSAPWFAHHVSSALRLADPGVRDSMLHGVQLAVPHERLVPVAASGVDLAVRFPDGDLTVRGRELSAAGGEYVWTLEISDKQGAVLERWGEVRFRALGPRREIPAIAAAPWLERRLGELAPGVLVHATAAARTYRPDGKPEPAGPGGFSASEAAGLRIALAGPERVACDLELVAPRPEVAWRDLLGASAALAPRVAAALGESIDRAATRVWCALECAAKLGVPDAPLLLRTADRDTAAFSAGDLSIATTAILVGDTGDLVAAVATAPAAPAIAATTAPPAEQAAS